MILTVCLKAPELRELDCSDDRLSLVLDRLGEDTAWDAYEAEQNSTLIRVYDLEVRQVRVDSTTAKSYVSVTEDGLFQLGHSKEHRPDLPPVKINPSVLDPWGMPLTTPVVSGSCADDPLSVPEIRKVQASMQRHGVLYVGDCKMAALATRAYIAGSEDCQLCPLPALQRPTATLEELLRPVWTGAQPLTPVYRLAEAENEKPQPLAEGFGYTVTLSAEHEGKHLEWEEQRLVVRSLKHAEAKEKALGVRLDKAEQAITALNARGRGRKRLDESEMRAAVDTRLARYDVTGLLDIDYTQHIETVQKRAYLGRPAQTLTTTTVTVQVSRNQVAYIYTVRTLGWRVFASNDPKLGLEEGVLAYRDEQIVERGFNRYRGKKLGLTPLYLVSTTRIKGLSRLLSIGLRMLCLVEFALRKSLQETGSTLDAIDAGNPKRATAKPTTEIMLKAFRRITLSVIDLNGAVMYCITPLNALQKRILTLLGFPLGIYQNLGEQLNKLGGEMGER